MLVPPEMAGLAGYGYMLVGLIEWWHGRRIGRLRKRLPGPDGGAAPPALPG
jgi:hypothetical protein